MSRELLEIYRQKITSDDPREQEDGLECAEEACYFDGAITNEQFFALLRIYAEVTGDHDILRQYGT